MLHKTSKSSIYIKSINKDLGGKPVVFIHGFMESSDSWKHIVENLSKWIIIIDLPGHNKSKFNNLNEEYSINDFCNELYLFFSDNNIRKIDLLGYSMGGRIAIAFSSKYPNLINSLVLESTSLGLDSKSSREERYNEDLELCKEIENNFNAMIDDWELKVLFKDQKKRNYILWEKQRNIRLNHNQKQLSKALRAFSVGAMPFYEESFKYFIFPIFIICGTDDSKYIKLGKEMMYMNKNVKQYIIAKASHNTHLENPSMFLNILKEEVFKT